MRLTDTHPPLHRAGRAAWALASGITGIAADVLLVLDQLTENLGAVRQSFMWLPAAIAWVMVVQFLTHIPVTLAWRRWLPPTAIGATGHGGGRRRLARSRHLSTAVPHRCPGV